MYITLKKKMMIVNGIITIIVLFQSIKSPEEGRETEILGSNETACCFSFLFHLYYCININVNI